MMLCYQIVVFLSARLPSFFFFCKMEIIRVFSNARIFLRIVMKIIWNIKPWSQCPAFGGNSVNDTDEERLWDLTDLGRHRRNRKSPGRKTVPWETVAWATACWSYPGQTDAGLRLASGVGLSSITGCSFNLSLKRCIKNNVQQKWHSATSSSQSDSDTQPVTFWRFCA